ncbi:MAG TPA: hypothetical protein VKE70_38415, partial [Candidatus Solibacter sp.]|nr:hypothetical protein [Candidatus Solibacter sp.]
MNEASSVEKQVLEDVAAQTGRSFRLLGSIDTRDRETAAAVLPVLVAWVDRLWQDSNHRRAIYSNFHTPHAYPFLLELLKWFERE